MNLNNLNSKKVVSTKEGVTIVGGVLAAGIVASVIVLKILSPSSPSPATAPAPAPTPLPITKPKLPVLLTAYNFSVVLADQKNIPGLEASLQKAQSGTPLETPPEHWLVGPATSASIQQVFEKFHTTDGLKSAVDQNLKEEITKANVEGATIMQQGNVVSDLLCVPLASGEEYEVSRSFPIPKNFSTDTKAQDELTSEIRDFESKQLTIVEEKNAKFMREHGKE